MTSETCTDVVVADGGPAVEVVYVAIAGEAELHVGPEGERSPHEPLAVATVILRDVVLQPERGGETVELAELELAEVTVGWLPG